MRRFLIALAAAGALAVASVVPAAAHDPCNDQNGDGSPSGFEYAKFHVSELAKQGLIGSVHKPGEHRGFSLCPGVHD